MSTVDLYEKKEAALQVYKEAAKALRKAREEALEALTAYLLGQIDYGPMNEAKNAALAAEAEKDTAWEAYEEAKTELLQRCNL